ncbi:hypothetical protein [Paludisphaera rhizosphaerae]|uniref:hypothetical protein n=1 Tax=Paludisphaera rhizosphaerae TaxID=2711216 RepID=UPI0013ED7E5C|nr:hypothetical protein [Paludisphaera rhizosphaerae]
MRSSAFIGLSVVVLVAGFVGCERASDPVIRQVEAEGTDVQIAPEATQGVAGAIRAQADQEKRQAEADKKAGRR